MKVSLKVPQLQKCQIVTKVPLSGYISAPLLQKFPMNVTKVPYQEGLIIHDIMRKPNPKIVLLYIF